MFSLDFILAQLYPYKKLEDLQKILDDDFRDPMLYPEYDTWTWKEVKQEDLSALEVQIRLIKTLFSTQYLYDGTVQLIMDSFEKWSKSGTIVFEGVTPDDQLFLERYYCFLGWLHFAHITYARKLYLLESRFLPLAIVWDIPVYSNTQDYFAQYIYVDGLREDSTVFADAMGRNETPLGLPEKGAKTIGEWMVIFDEFEGSSIPTRVDEFMNDKMEIQRLNEDEKKILYKIITLYWGLRGGFIYREIENEVPGSYTEKAKKENKSVDDYYLEALYEATREQFKQWLTTCGEAAYWMYLTKKDQNFIKKLIYILLEKANLDDDDEAQMLIEFFMVLEEFGLTGLEDVIYFDESKGGFAWDEDRLVGLQPIIGGSEPDTKSGDKKPPKELFAG